MTILAQWIGRHPISREATEPGATEGLDAKPTTSTTLRQVLDGLGTPRPVVWIPHRDAWYRRLVRVFATGLAWPFRQSGRDDGTVYAAAGLLVLLLIGIGGWYLEGRRVEMQPTLAVAATTTSARLDQIARSFKAPLLAEESEKTTLQRSPILESEALTEVNAGQATRLRVRTLDLDTAEPETVAIVNGVPETAHLSDGIMIGPGLWMLRPELLSSVEVDTGQSAPGEHVLTFELRTAAGTKITEARTTLAIRASIAQITEKPSEPLADAQSDDDIPAASSSHARREPALAAHRRAVHAKAAKPIAKADKVAVAPRQSSRHNEPRRLVNRPKATTTIATSPPKPVMVQQAAAPRLIWPGDKPEAGYQSSPPVFLGGALPVPNVIPPPSNGPEQPQNPGWHKRAFKNPSGN